MPQLISTQRQRRLFRRFIVVSIALHLLVGSAFFLPDYLGKLKGATPAVVAKEQARRRHQQNSDDLAKAAAAATQQAATQAAADTKQELTAELHDEFRGVVGDQLQGADADEMWAELLAQMTAGLDDYSQQAVDPNAVDSDLREKMTDLQAKMLAELAAQLRARSHKELADAFVARVKGDVSPKLIEFYRHQLNLKIGDALRDEGTKIVRDDAADLRDRKKALTTALADAARQASSAVTDLALAKKKAQAVAAGVDALRLAGKGDAADAKLAGAVRDARESVEKAGQAVQAAAGRLEDASKKADGFAANIKQAIRAAQDDIDRTKSDVAKAAGDAQAAKAADFSKSQAKAADSAGELVAAIKLAQENASNDRADLSTPAKVALKHARDEDLKQLIEKAFWENYAKRSAPRLGGKLTGVFKETVEKAGIKDDAMVADVEKRVQDALINDVRDKVHAGEAGTDPLSKTLKLDEVADGPAGPAGVHDPGNKAGSDNGHGAGHAQANAGGGAATQHAPADAAHHADPREQAIADRIGKTARDLVKANIEGIGNDDGGDEVALKAARAGTVVKTPHGDGEDGDGLAGLAARMDRLADNVKGGRTDLADAALAAGGKGGAAGAGPAGLGAFGRHLPGDNEHYHGPLLRYHPHITDEAMYARLTADIHTRDALAARGQATTRRSADGEAAANSAGSDTPFLHPAAILVPGDSKAEPIGQPLKSAPFVPKFKTIRFAAIPYRNKPIVIDGDLSEWKDVPELAMTPSREIEGDAPNLKQFPQAVKVQWDNTGFYLAYDVKDADDKITKVKPGDFWEGDGIEFWVDSLNTKEKYRTKSSHQFWAWVDGALDNPAWVGGEARSWPGKDEYLPLGADVIKTASKKTPAGWTIEVFFPATKFRMLDLQPGRILGMNFSICTGTHLYYYWAGTTKVATARRPDTWGDALLAGSAGRLECLDKLTAELSPGQTAKPVNAVRIGEPLRIRVTDADMNLSNTERDRVAVTVATRRGARLPVILEETGNATGIFEGALRTTLDTGQAADGVLPLLDGDQVDLVYIDQCRPDGARDVPVKLTLPTASAVTKLADK
ncbi:MAG TPA: sugar-binding protein [Tepidisphaeraceae bacterium]|jgi:hypothetical protein|nr:sugar-binding protein [Tepidisphaeraceae bacterium]